jgi:hypothetical protein
MARLPRHARVRVGRLLGRPSGARLTVDRLTFDLSEADLHELARQLVAVLGARPPLDHPQPTGDRP